MIRSKPQIDGQIRYLRIEKMALEVQAQGIQREIDRLETKKEEKDDG